MLQRKKIARMSHCFIKSFQGATELCFTGLIWPESSSFSNLFVLSRNLYAIIDIILKFRIIILHS